MVVLTEKVALRRANANSLENVVRLNLWNAHITDISILRHMPNLEILTLSVNSLTSLKDLAACAKLRELYVRSNTIASLKELQHVRGSLCLRVLWLSDNPCADDADYRMHAIQMLPQLHVLDGVDIEDDERLDASSATMDISRQSTSSFASSMTSEDQTDSRHQLASTTQSQVFTATTMAENPILAAVGTLLDTLGPDALQAVLQMTRVRITKTTVVGGSPMGKSGQSTSLTDDQANDAGRTTEEA